MKTPIVNICKMLSSVVLGLSALTASAQVSHKIIFDQPYVLNSTKAVSVMVEKVRSKLNRTSNAWESKVSGAETKFCSVQMKIEGRDLALRNQSIGEHYFGSLSMTCDRSLTIPFSRVLYLGIRNCVESETMMDQDYCELKVVAFMKESDVTKLNGALVEDTKEVKSFYRVHSQVALVTANKDSQVPEGLNPSQISAIQVFSLSVAKHGQDFFISQNSANTANFSKGINIYLSSNAEQGNRDEVIAQNITSTMASLEQAVQNMQSSSNPKKEFEEKIAGILSQYTVSAKQLLSIVSPVRFFAIEKLMMNFEMGLLNVAKSLNPVVTDRDSFTQEYAKQVADYSKVGGYLTKKLRVKAKATKQEQVPDTQSKYTQLFLQEDDGVGYGKSYLSQSGYACYNAASVCNTYVTKLADAPLYSCEFVEQWNTSAKRYCKYGVVKIRNSK